MSIQIKVASCLLPLLLMAGCGTRSTVGKTPATIIVVEASFPGANCKVLADTVAAPIEQQVSGVADSVHLMSRCTNDGKYTLAVSFRSGTDIDTALVLVQNRVALALPVLPDTVQRAGVSVRKKAPLLMIVSLSSPQDRHDAVYMSNYAAIYLKDDLARLPDVGEVVSFGQPETTIRVILNPAKLAAHQMTAVDITNAVAQQKVQVAGGPIGQAPERNQFQLSIAAGSGLSVEDFADLIIKTDSKGANVRLKDVGRLESRSIASKFLIINGKPGVCLAIYPIRGARELGGDLEKKLTQLRTRLPDGLRLELAFDFTANLEAPTGPRTPEYLLIDLHSPIAGEKLIDVLKRCDKLLRDLPGVQDVLAQTENPFDFVRDRPCILARLAPADQRKISRQELVRSIRAELEKVADMTVGIRDLARPGSFPRYAYPIDLAVSGPVAEKAQELAEKLAARLRKNEKLTDVAVNQDSKLAPGVCLEIDRKKAQLQDVSLSDIFNTLQIQLGSTHVNDFHLFGKTLQVALLTDGARKSVDDLMQFKVRNNKGEMIALKAFITVRGGDVPTAINRLDLQPFVQITANPAADIPPPEARALCESLFAEVRRDSKLSADYRLIWLQELVK